MKIIHIAGARPNFMKIAPLLKAMRERTFIENLLVHTGQHYDQNMSDVFFKDLNIPNPDVNLGAGSGSNAVQTARIMIAFEKVALEYQPDLIIVVGDVNSTLACSLVAAKIGIPIAHVEAGVRSFDRTMPEEINRVVTDALAELLFTPSLEANQNLRKEGIAEHKIHFVGNILVDCLMSSLERAKSSQTWQRWGLFPGHYALLTLHRVSNVDDSLVLSQIIEALGEVSSEIPVIFPAHPRTTRRLSEYGLLNRVQTSPGIILAEPLSYLEFLSLMVGAKLVLTDSGGIQAETSVLGVPCLTLRSNTEWPETIREGTNILVGTNRKTILKETLSIIDTGGKKGKRPEKWDGNTATRILQGIVDFLSSV